MGDEGYRKIISEETTEVMDHVTGEVVTTSRTNIARVEKTPDFVMLFTRDLGYLKNISGGASKLLFGMIMYVDRNNEITLNKSRKDQIAEKIGINPNSINPLLTQLVKNDVLLKAENATGIYILNPYIFGKGQWKNISKLRMLVEYDFNAGTKKVAYETSYENPDSDDMIEQMIANRDSIIDVIAEQNNEKESDPAQNETKTGALPFFNEDSNTKQSSRNSEELELLKERNREMELKIRAKELGMDL